MKMKSILKAGIMAAVLCMPFLMFGQEAVKAVKKAPETKEEKALKQSERMKTELNLTNEQYKAVYDINLKLNDEKEQAAASVKENYDKELKKVLTDEQYKTMKSNANKQQVQQRPEMRRADMNAVESKKEAYQAAPVRKESSKSLKKSNE